MTFSVGGLIQATDINDMLSNGTDNLNAVWSTGSGNSGYGQTAVSTVNVGDIVTLTAWSSLIDDVRKVANHQGSSITSRTTPAVGDIISFFSNLTTDISTIKTNRLNAASQGGTSTSSGSTSSSWSDYCTLTATISFGSHDAARYFFNAGGQIGVSFSHPSSTNINNVINGLCSEAGTIWLSSGSCTLSGTSYTGTYKSGGATGGGSTTSTGVNFYSLGSAQLHQQLTSSSYSGAGNFPGHSGGVNYASSTTLTITASYNGSGTLTITTTIDEVPNGASVVSGTSCTVTARPPSTSYLSNTWGTPTLSVSASTA
jgi:hypothetical protein